MRPRIPRRRSLGPAEPARTEERWIGDWQFPEGLPRNLRSWLLEPGLLTDRIARETSQPPTLHLLSLHWGDLTAGQRTRLNVEGSRCFVREIELITGPRRWVFAQTLVPESKRALQSWLAALGSQPLGEALDTMKGVVQGALEFCFLPPSHPLLQSALRGHSLTASRLWARRRWIALSSQRLLLQEVLLPDLP